jgi:hypothetical protein
MRRGAVRVEVEHRFGVSVREGFDYITDPANWPAFWPRFVRLDPDSRWRDQGRLPAARHWRHFDDDDGGLAYRIVIEYSPRAGWRGLLDRTVVRQATTRTARTTMANLERRFHG